MVLKGIHFLKSEPSQVFCDNDAVIKLAEDQVWHSKCKHIRVKYHYVRDQVLAKELRVNRIHTNDNLADIFTKALSRPDFLRHHSKLGLVAPAVEEESYITEHEISIPFNPYHILYTYNTYDSSSNLSEPIFEPNSLPDSLSLNARVEEEC